MSPEMNPSTRSLQNVEALCVAAIRALSGNASAHFRGQRLHVQGRAVPLYAPHLHPQHGSDDFHSFRGAADGLALRLLKSDAALHAQLAPDHPVERLLFDLLEQFRVEALAGDSLPGVQTNLEHRFAAWSEAYHQARLTETARGILLFTAAQVCRSRVTGNPIHDVLANLIEATRDALGHAVGFELAALRKLRHNQRAYADVARALAIKVANMLGTPEAPGNDQREAEDNEQKDRAAFSLMMSLQPQPLEGMPMVASGQSRSLQIAGGNYKIFSRAFDTERLAWSDVRVAQLKDYRHQLDVKVAAQGINVRRLARALRSLFARDEWDGWNSEQEEGRIDGRRLSQLVSVPGERRLFCTERMVKNPNCVASFLVDCSGSMKQHIEHVAVLIDTLARAFELADIPCEVLGFSTGAWNGGRVRKQWLREGSVPMPGRLNEVAHLVFKDAQTPWRKGKLGIAALLKSDQFREGIDGEAVQWACARLLKIDADRRLLFVVSDGCPMDGATHLANDNFYLDNHLKNVVAQAERISGIGVFGMGVGLDLSPFYAQSHALDFTNGVRSATYRDLLGLIQRGR
jgi:cobaltochelatase CobT